MSRVSMTGSLAARAFGFLRTAIAGAVDQYFNLVTLLLPGNGTNGAQNNTFLDSSTNNFSITRNGNTTQGTFSPFSQTGWGNYFDGTGDFLNFASSASFGYGTGDYTIEGWVWSTTRSVANTFFANGTDNCNLYIKSSTGIIGLYTGSANDSATALPLNQWNHIAVVRNGSGSNNTQVYLNGTSILTITNTTNFSNTTFFIGRNGASGSEYMNGYISNVRVTKGRAVYTSSFTPPASPLGKTSGGQNPPQGTECTLLTCQSNRFVDNSDAALTVTPNADSSVQAFSPFAPTAEYSAATVGGSGYFDGTGDYLQIAANSAFQFDADFTVECWFYSGTSTTTGKYDQIIGTIESATAGYWRLGSEFNGGKQLWFTWTTGSYNDILTSFSVSDNAWHHLAVSRISNSVRLFVDGVQRGSTTTVTTNLNANAPLMIMNSTQGTNQTQGYVSSVRIIKGQGLYNGTFTPPTAPFTTSSVGSTGSGAASSITGTVSILTNFTNAAITDATAKNVLETVGNAQISTTQSKFGGSSIFFDGTGDYLFSPSSQNFAFPGDFTIEFWSYITAVSGEGNTFYVTTTGGINIFLNISSNWGIARSGTAVDNNFGTPPAQNTWNHIAVSRSGSTINAYINGTRVFTGTNTSNYVAGPLQFGLSAFGSITGYIDDLRVTKFARYTGSTLTVPTAAFPLQ